ncbi:tetratricopeptide repeat protein 22-like [Ptychodera flava]|uniref:tetratricopeptide repeat protein 22-like n=1 Tax=Ptychodera flava TaxID=63121 RepID=UPI00396A667D
MASQLRKTIQSSPDDCGHFRLPLLLLSKDVDKRSLNARYDSLTKQLENETGFFRHGLSNMLGLLEFQKGEMVKACQTFKEILEKDFINLNALSNLTTVYERMDRTRKAEEYRDKLSEVLKDQGRLSGEERQAALLRCVAEQAYSLAFDCYDEKTRMPPKCEEAISLYELVLKESENVTAVDTETFKWKMCIAIIRYNRLVKHCLWDNSGEKDDEVINESIALLHLLKDILNNCTDGFYQSQCWCYIGMLLMKGKHLIDTTSHPKNQETLRQLDLVNCYEQPLLCFQAAETCYDGGWKELVKFAKLLIKDKQYEYALQVIEKSLAKNSDKSNWHAYEQRANIYKKMYDVQSHKLQKQDGVPDKTLLRKAEADLELCLEVMDYSPLTLLEMVRVQIRLCQNQKRWFDYEVEDMHALDKAFEILAKIKNTEGTHEYAYKFYLEVHGDCLMYAKEYSDASAKYEEAIILNRGGRFVNFSALLNALFRLLRQHRQSGTACTDDLEAIVIKFQKYQGLYKKEQILRTIRNLSRTFREEFRDVDRYSLGKTGMKLQEIIESSNTR